MKNESLTETGSNASNTARMRFTVGDDYRYTAAWRRYRVLHNLTVGLFLGFVPFGVALGYIFHDGSRMFIPAGVWALAFLIAGAVETYWRCPACGARFKTPPFYDDKRCAKCGIKNPYATSILR